MGSGIVAVLDANVLFPAVLRDHLLHLAEQGVYRPLWTDAILQEMRRAILAKRPDLSTAQMDHLEEQMRHAFPEAWVEDGYQQLVPLMPNEAGDRHVLAAAVYAKAWAIVTYNVRHFPNQVCASYAVQTFLPDDFLCHLLQEDPEGVLRALAAHAQDLQRPPQTPVDVLARLERHAPRYTQAIAGYLARPA